MLCSSGDLVTGSWYLNLCCKLVESILFICLKIRDKKKKKKKQIAVQTVDLGARTRNLLSSSFG